MTEIRVPGFDAVELLGYGSQGEVWLAREHATGEPVALKRLLAGADLAARDRLRREAAVLAGVDHPHVLRLRSVVGAGPDLVLVLDLATGGSLARLLATRGRLSPGEVVTVAVPLAEALAAVHAQGVVHGDVTPANVLFTGDGRPVLSDLGVARLLGAADPVRAGTAGYADPAAAGPTGRGPASDVHGLAATCFAALAGHPPYDDDGRRLPAAAGAGPLLDVLERALSTDPADRPAAAELAGLVFDTAGPVPVGMDHTGSTPWAGQSGSSWSPGQTLTHVGPGHAPEPAPDPPVRRSRGRRVRRAGAGAGQRLRARWRTGLAMMLSAVALAMAAVTGIAWAGSGADPRPGGVDDAAGRPVAAGPTGRATASTSWAHRLAALDAARSAAFARADRGALAAVYAPASPALRRDLGVLDRLVDAGLRADGLRLRAMAVTETARSGDRVRLSVEDVMPAYRLVDSSGRVVAERTGRERSRWTVTLSRVAGEWRVYDVARG